MPALDWTENTWRKVLMTRMFRHTTGKTQEYRDGKMGLKYLLECLGLWVLELFLFWLALKTQGTSKENAAEFVMVIADKNQ